MQKVSFPEDLLSSLLICYNCLLIRGCGQFISYITLISYTYYNTVFPRNVAVATFNFVVQFGVATFRGRRLKYSQDYMGGASTLCAIILL